MFLELDFSTGTIFRQAHFFGFVVPFFFFTFVAPILYFIAFKRFFNSETTYAEGFKNFGEIQNSKVAAVRVS